MHVYMYDTHFIVLLLDGASSTLQHVQLNVAEF